jgi:hypothetical protein
VYEEQIRAGIALLDEHDAVPDDWRDLINRDLLNMQFSDLCIVGQLIMQSQMNQLPMYTMAQQLGAPAGVGNTFNWACGYGFDTETDYERLTDEWLGYLNGDWR